MHPPKQLSQDPWVDPPQCMPEEYKTDDAVTAYRRYYLGEKAYFAVWPAGKIPTWFKTKPAVSKEKPAVSKEKPAVSKEKPAVIKTRARSTRKK
jgi:hypothetical protein